MSYFLMALISGKSQMTRPFLILIFGFKFNFDYYLSNYIKR